MSAGGRGGGEHGGSGNHGGAGSGRDAKGSGGNGNGNGGGAFLSQGLTQPPPGFAHRPMPWFMRNGMPQTNPIAAAPQAPVTPPTAPGQLLHPGYMPIGGGSPYGVDLQYNHFQTPQYGQPPSGQLLGGQPGGNPMGQMGAQRPPQAFPRGIFG